MAAITLPQTAESNNRREIFGWAMYDWANSAFSTTVITVFLGPYLASLARTAAQPFLDGNARLGPLAIAPDSVLPYCVSLSVFLQVFFLPVLGAIADYSHIRKRMMQLFATIGAVATILLFLVASPAQWWFGGLLFIIANLAFGASIVFYNAFLPDIASPDQRDRVSSYGWAMGYLGGGLLLLLNLIFFQFHESLGISTSLAVRICLATAGLWWLGFSLITWARLRSRRAPRTLPPGKGYVSVGFRQLGGTIRELRRFPETLKFLLAYFLYNDGIQTVIAISAVFAAAPILRGGLGMGQTTLSLLVLMIQFIAFFGALFWGRLAQWITAKRAVIVSLVIWAGVVIYAYVGLKGANATVEFFALGIIIAVVLGGSQAISRSLFAQMIPRGREAEFYSFYEISERGTSWIGPLLFGLMNQVFHNLRPAILSLIFFFVAGLIILPLVNVPKAIRDAQKSEVEPAAAD